MSVAIIGAGPSGLIALDALIRENKFQRVRLFERNKEAGGAWLFSRDPPQKLGDLKELSSRTPVKFDEARLPNELPGYTTKSTQLKYSDSSIYSELESNVDATSMEFSEEVIPQTASAKSLEKFGDNTPFRTHVVVKGWIQDLYKRKGYDDHVEFNTSVELAEKDKATGKWNVLLRRLGLKKDYLWQEQFDFLLVASGLYYVPYVPLIPGLQEFNDKFPFSESAVLHTKQFRSKETFRNKKVVVVGASVSAIDALHDILKVAKLPVISSIKKTTLLNPIVGTAPFEHSGVERHSQIVKIDPENRSVHFDDNSVVYDVDTIIFGTGYSYSYPFLPNLKITNNRVNNLFQLVSYIPDPTLAFVGGVSGGLTFKVFEWQAVLAARIFLGRAKLPSVEEQYKWEQDRLLVKGNTHKFNLIFPDYRTYLEDLRELATNDGPGRKLPVFDQYWVDKFIQGARRRGRFFVESNHKL